MLMKLHQPILAWHQNKGYHCYVPCMKAPTSLIQMGHKPQIRPCHTSRLIDFLSILDEKTMIRYLTFWHDGFSVKDGKSQ